MQINNYEQRRLLGRRYYNEIKKRKTDRAQIKLMNKYYRLGVGKTVLKQAVGHSSKWYEKYRNELLFIDHNAHQ